VPDLKEILLNKNVAVPKNYETFKDIFRHFKGRSVGNVKGDDGPLMNRADEFYLTSPINGFLQGDVLENVPSTWIQTDENGDLAAFASQPSSAMIVSAECDCEKRNEGSEQAYIRLCPIFSQLELLNETPADRKADVRGKLERNYFSEYFWMPSPRKKEEPLIVDLSHFFSVSLRDIYLQVERGTIKRKLSLSQESYFLLLIKLAWFMLRPAAPDTQRNDLQPWVAE
jgi:hypothetical protein